MGRQCQPRGQPRCQPHFRVKRLAAIALAVLALPATGRDYALEFGVGLPRQSGYLQTPAGGMPGSATPRRPTLSEICLDEGGYQWLAANVDFPLAKGSENDEFGSRLHLRFKVRYSAIADEASAVFDEALTIRGGTFEVGDRVLSQVSFDGLTLALTAVFDITPGLSAESGVEVGWTAFDFTMAGERHRSERAYHVNTVGVVGAFRRDFGNGWHLHAGLGASPAIEGTGRHYMAESSFRREVSRRVSLAIGARLEKFRYDDAHKQALPNRLRVTRRLVPTLSLAADLGDPTRRSP